MTKCRATGMKVSLATVYNTLHQFTEAGLLRQVVDAARPVYFDTNTGDHQHFFLENEGMLIDIPGGEGDRSPACRPPPGLTRRPGRRRRARATLTSRPRLPASHSTVLELF